MNIFRQQVQILTICALLIGSVSGSTVIIGNTYLKKIPVTITQTANNLKAEAKQVAQKSRAWLSKMDVEVGAGMQTPKAQAKAMMDHIGEMAKICKEISEYTQPHLASSMSGYLHSLMGDVRVQISREIRLGNNPKSKIKFEEQKLRKLTAAEKSVFRIFEKASKLHVAWSQFFQKFSIQDEKSYKTFFKQGNKGLMSPTKSLVEDLLGLIGT